MTSRISSTKRQILEFEMKLLNLDSFMLFEQYTFGGTYNDIKTEMNTVLVITTSDIILPFQLWNLEFEIWYMDSEIQSPYIVFRFEEGLLL